MRSMVSVVSRFSKLYLQFNCHFGRNPKNGGSNKKITMMRAAALSIMSLLWTGSCYGSLTAQEASASASFQDPRLVLRIDQPKRHSIEKYINQLDSNVILINKTGTITLRLDCWASYPIDLKFLGHRTNQVAKVKTFRKEHGTIENPQTWFIINATMESFEEITGNYTCASIEDPVRSSSYYIFVSSTPPGVLLSRGQRIEIQPKLEETRVIFPCAVSHPDIHVQLFKNDEKLATSDDNQYHPKVGFTMPFDLRESSVFGSYSCRTKISPHDRVNFTLTPPKNYRVEPMINNIRIQPNEHLNVSCDATENFIIVSQPQSLPVIQNEVKPVSTFENASELHYRYAGRFMAGPLKPGDSGYVSCKWKRSNITFAEWSFSVLNKENRKPGQLDSARLLTACPNSSSLILYECSNPIECRINSCLRKDPQCQSNAQFCKSEKYCMHSGLIQCVSDKVSVVEMFFTGFPTSIHTNKTNKYVDWRYARNEELLLLEKVSLKAYQRDVLDIMGFTCQGSNFVFSSGFKWIVHFENEMPLVVTSLKEHNGDGINVTVKNLLKDKNSNLESTLIISSVKLSKKKISLIECQAPVWDSWQWISRNISVDDDEIRSFRNENVFGKSASSAILSSKIMLISCFLVFKSFMCENFKLC